MRGIGCQKYMFYAKKDMRRVTMKKELLGSEAQKWNTAAKCPKKKQIFQLIEAMKQTVFGDVKNEIWRVKIHVI